MAKPKQEPETAETSAPVYIDYRGVSGPAQEFKHDGELAIARPGGGDPLTLAPGLNIVDGATWAAFGESASVKLRLEAQHITVSDESLTRYRNPSAWRSLIERTESGDALEHMQRIELAKPQSGTPAERRDPSIVALLEKRIARAVRRPLISLAGLHSTVAQTASLTSPQEQFRQAERKAVAV